MLRTRPASSPLDGALEAAWLLAALLVPLWVVVGAQQAFEPPKVALVRTLAWALLGLWLVDHLLRGAAPAVSWRSNPLARPATAVVLALALATLLAPDPRLALFGSHTRGQGLMTWIAYLAIFFVVADRLRSPEQARRLVIALVVPAGPMVLLGAFQAVGLDPLGFTTDARSPIYGTLGRANFVGAYLAMLLPLTLALLVTAEGRGARAVRWALGTLAFGQVVVVGLTLVRGAWLAAAVGTVAFLLVTLWPGMSLRRRAAAMGATAAVAAAFLVSGGAALLQADAGSVAARRTIWVTVWALVRERPLHGYGPDSLELVFPRLFPPQLVYYQGREVFVDRAHNLLLDWAVTGGLLGVVALAWLLVACYAVGLGRWRALDDEPARRRTLLAAALAAVAANLAGNMTGFDVTATATATWLLLALVASPATAPGSVPTSDPSTVQQPDGERGWKELGGMAVVGLVTAVAIVTSAALPLAAEVAHRTSVERARLGDWRGAVAAAERATRLWRVEPEHHRLLGRTHLERALAPGGEPAALEAAERSLLAARDMRPLDYASWATLGRFYFRTGVAVDAGALQWAHPAYQRAIALAPHFARLHVAWGEVFVAEERPELAFERFERALALDATDAVAARWLGEVAMVLGLPETAVAAYEQAVGYDPGAMASHLGLARAYQILGEEDLANAALGRARHLEPGHPAVEALAREIANDLEHDAGETSDDH